MEENVHRGAHALTGFMFAPSVIMLSLLNDGFRDNVVITERRDVNQK